MLIEIGERLRRAMPFEIIGRRAYHAMETAERTGNIVRLLQRLREHDGDVESFFEQIGDALMQREIHFDERLLLHIARHERHHITRAEAAHRMNAQPSRGHHGGVARLGFGLLEIVEDRPTAREKALACFGQGDLARRAVEQTRLQMRFEIGHRTRGIGRGRVERVGCRREVARVHDTYEDPHALDEVRGSPPELSLLRMMGGQARLARALAGVK